MYIYITRYVATFDSNYSFLLNLLSAGSNLSSVLGYGNETGDSSLIVSDPTLNPNAKIQGQDSAIGVGGDLNLRGGNSSFSTGGDIIFSAGTGIGSDGLIRFVGDLVITGSFSGSISFKSGSGSPESAITAPVGSIYQRLDGSIGNSVYFKVSGVGNVGWVPVGPKIEENKTATGGTDVFTLSRDFFRNPSMGIEISVFWNGIKLVNGGSENGFITIGTNQIQISSVPYLNDIISIQYLPR